MVNFPKSSVQFKEINNKIILLERIRLQLVNDSHASRFTNKRTNVRTNERTNVRT